MDNFLGRGIAISTIAALTACGGDMAESPSYVGNTLFIDGIPYSRGEISKNIVPGEIVIVPKEGMREEVRKLIANFQLRILREDSRSILAGVPPGYETHWAAAFSKQGAVVSAAPNSVQPAGQSGRN